MSILQIRHRLTGTAGSPAGTGFKSGEVALNFSPAGTPEFWAYNGSAWKQVNPPAAVSVGNVALPGGTSGSATGIGAAYAALTTKPTATIVTATFAGTSYIRTGAGTADGDWVALGAATAFASAADVRTGTDVSRAINAAALAGASHNAPTGAGGAAAPADAGYWVRLDANGQIAAGFIPAHAKASAGEIVAGTDNAKMVTAQGLKGAVLAQGTGAGGAAVAADAGHLVALGASGKISPQFLPATQTVFKGSQDFTVAAPAGFTTSLPSGAYYFATKTGTVGTGWTGVTGTVKSGDMMVWDGTNWHLIPNETDLNAYLPLTGGTMAQKSSKISWPAATAATPETYLDLNGGGISNCLIDLGTY